MRFKTGIIIAVSVLLTIILMNNTESISFWLFYEVQIPKLVVMGTTLLIGLILGLLLKRKKSNKQDDPETAKYKNKHLSDQDSAYL